METLNFTQFCSKHGYPDDYSCMFQAQLLGSRGLAGSMSKRSIKEGDDAFHKMQARRTEAKQLYRDAIARGEVIDPSGEVTKEDILKRRTAAEREAIESKIKGEENYIRTITGLGRMAHMKSGKLKKGYQLAYDTATANITALKEQLNQI